MDVHPFDNHRGIVYLFYSDRLDETDICPFILIHELFPVNVDLQTSSDNYLARSLSGKETLAQRGCHTWSISIDDFTDDPIYHSISYHGRHVRCRGYVSRWRCLEYIIYYVLCETKNGLEEGRLVFSYNSYDFQCV